MSVCVGVRPILLSLITVHSCVLVARLDSDGNCVMYYVGALLITNDCAQYVLLADDPKCDKSVFKLGFFVGFQSFNLKPLSAAWLVESELVSQMETLKPDLYLIVCQCSSTKTDLLPHNVGL